MAIRSTTAVLRMKNKCNSIKYFSQDNDSDRYEKLNSSNRHSCFLKKKLPSDWLLGFRVTNSELPSVLLWLRLSFRKPSVDVQPTFYAPSVCWCSKIYIFLTRCWVTHFEIKHLESFSCWRPLHIADVNRKPQRCLAKLIHFYYHHRNVVVTINKAFY